MPTSSPVIFRLQGSSEYVWGLFLFAAVAVGVGQFAFLGGFWRYTCYALAALLAGGGLIDYLFYHKRLVELTAQEIRVARGLWGKPRTYPLAHLVEARLRYTQGEQVLIKSLAELSLAEIEAAQIKELTMVTSQGAAFTIPSFNHDPLAHQRFVKELCQLAQTGRLGLPVGGQPVPPPAPELPDFEPTTAQALADCQAYLASDQALAQSLRQNLYDAHASVYRPHLAPAGTDLGGLPVAYTGPVANGQVAYFLADDFLPDASLADRELAQNLIATAQQHLALAQGRIEVYQKMADQLQRLATEQARRQQLRQIADQLDQLQPLSLERASHQDTFTLDLAALAEAQRLSAQLEAEHDLTRAEALRQYAALLKTHFGS
jgi:hypothetical protein